MYLKTGFVIVLCTLKLCKSINEKKDSILLKLDPAEIVETFKTVITSNYIREMANQMATKAAQHFIQEMKNKNIQLEMKQEETAAFTGKPEDIPTIQPQPNSRPLPIVLQKQKSKLHSKNMQQNKEDLMREGNKRPQKVLDENVAFALLKEPSPDGDDWELDSLEMTEIRNSIPVVEVKKINGVYFRRWLGQLFT